MIILHMILFDQNRTISEFSRAWGCLGARLTASNTCRWVIEPSARCGASVERHREHALAFSCGAGREMTSENCFACDAMYV